MGRPRVAVAPIPVPEPGEHDDAAERHQREPGKAALPAWENDECGGERPERGAEIAADLEQRLREAMRSARREAGHARRFGMEDGRTQPQQHRAGHQYRVARREGERDQPGHRRGHSERQRIGHRPAVGVEADERLKQRGRHLISESQKPDLREAQVEVSLQDGIDGGKQRLQHVIEQMAEARSEEDGKDRPARFRRRDKNFDRVGQNRAWRRDILAQGGVSGSLAMVGRRKILRGACRRI